MMTLAVPRTPWLQLLVCLFMDFICGNASYLVPLLGESFDLVCAPMQALLMSGMFDKQEPNAKYVGLLEEILPGTDIIPSATLTWLKINAHLFQATLKMVKGAKEMQEDLKRK